MGIAQVRNKIFHSLDFRKVTYFLILGLSYVRQISQVGREMVLLDLKSRYYPEHVRISMRRHQIAGFIREGIQDHLAGE